MLQPVTPPPTITTWARLGTAPPAVTGSIVTSASKPTLTWRYA
jgi:hypothetical protein